MNSRTGLFALFAVLIIASAAAAGELGDNQIWSTVTITKKMFKRFDVRFGPELQWAENASMHYLTRHEIGVNYIMENGFRPGLAFKRIIVYEPVKAVIYDVPFLELKFKRALNGFSLALRHRLEIFTAEGMNPFYRVRQRIKVTMINGFGPVKLRPFGSEEFFAVLDDGTLNKNRLNIGAVIDVSQFARIELYYMLQKRRTPNKWPSDHVLGANFDFYL